VGVTIATLTNGQTAAANATAIAGAIQTTLINAGINDFTVAANGDDIKFTFADTFTDDITVTVTSTQGNLETVSGFTSPTNLTGDRVLLTSANGMAVTVNEAGESGIQTVAGTTVQGANTDEATDYGSYTLTSNKEITIAAGTAAGADVTRAGLVAGSYSAQTAYTSTTSNNGLAMGTGEVEINGVLIGASQASSDTFSRYASSVTDPDQLTAASAIAKVAAFNAVSDQTGVTATVNATTVDGTSMSGGTAGTGTITINGVTTGTIGVANVNGDANVAADNRAVVLQAINAISNQTGVVAVDTNDMGSGIKLVAADGRNINLQFGGGLTGANTGLQNITSAISLTGSAAGVMGALDFTLNGVHIISTAPADAAGLTQILNSYTSQTGVTFTNNAGTLTAATSGGQDIIFSDLSGAEAMATGFSNGTTNGTSSTTFGTYTLSSAAEFTIEKGTAASLANTGLAVGTYGAGKSGTALADVDISTVEGATEALQAIDNAIASVNTNRGNLGAVQNRFTSMVSAIESVSENLSNARSRIVDADFAAETSMLTRNQILQQAGVAMLAQANQLPQQVLSLLRG
jgi:flagellin